MNYACTINGTQELGGSGGTTPEECACVNLQDGRETTFFRTLGHTGGFCFVPGGPDARHSERAWASFRQVWPAAVTPDTSGAFDVSDVDVTNFPEFGCLRLEYRESCEAGTDHPKADIAGWEVGGGITYVQYKNPPEGEEELEALKDTLIPYCNKVAVCTQVLDTTTGEATTIATAISTKRGHACETPRPPERAPSPRLSPR